jgi:hypothetical protein
LTRYPLGGTAYRKKLKLLRFHFDWIGLQSLFLVNDDVVWPMT